jgi:histone H3/H4
MAKKVEALVVGSKVKALIKSNKCLTSGELLDALSAKVAEVVAGACARAKKNGRSTVRAHDL